MNQTREPDVPFLVLADRAGSRLIKLDEDGYVYGGEIGPQNLQRWEPLYPVFGKNE